MRRSRKRLRTTFDDAFKAAETAQATWANALPDDQPVEFPDAALPPSVAPAVALVNAVVPKPSAEYAGVTGGSLTAKPYERRVRRATSATPLRCIRSRA